MSDPYTIFCRPPANSGEVYRIWQEMELGDYAYTYYILEMLGAWIIKNNCIQTINDVEYVCWTLPGGSRFVSQGPAFVRWFLCGLQVYNMTNSIYNAEQPQQEEFL